MWMWICAYLAVGLVVAGIAGSSGALSGPIPSILAGVLWPLTLVWYLALLTIFGR